MPYHPEANVSAESVVKIMKEIIKQKILQEGVPRICLNGTVHLFTIRLLQDFHVKTACFHGLFLLTRVRKLKARLFFQQF